MSARFQAKAMVHPVLRCLYMNISAPFSKVKKKRKERKRERKTYQNLQAWLSRGSLSCSTTLVQCPPLAKTGSHQTILTGLTKFKKFAYFVPWLYIIVVARILGAFNMTHQFLFSCGYLLCLAYFFLYLVLNSIKSLISDRILSTKSSVKSKYVNKISG